MDLQAASARKSLALCILLHILTCWSGQLCAGSQKQQQQQQQQQQVVPSSSGASNVSTDEILKDTMLLLDALDQKLTVVNNRTPSALMRDNLRALDGAYEEELRLSGRSLAGNADEQDSSGRLEESSLEEALVKLADGFASGRKSDDLAGELIAANEPTVVNDYSSPSSAQQQQSHYQDQSAKTAPSLKGVKRARQLMSSSSGGGAANSNAAAAASSALDDNQLASDSTERHIKFTLDLMQSIFSSQSYSSKTNLIDSFLISPLSIQMVLMMMHLGARGQTRREISTCLHLQAGNGGGLDRAALSAAQPQPPVMIGNDLAGETVGSKLKRRHHQQQQQQQVSGEFGKSLASGKLNQPPRQLLTAASPSQQQQQQTSGQAVNAHELFGGAMRNLLKDPIVMKALTSANQIFLQKNLPLSPQYESAIRHYYAADVKLVDFQHQSTSTTTSTSPINAPNSSPPSTSTSAAGKPLLANGEQHSPLNVSSAAPSSSSSSVNSTALPGEQPLNNIQQMVNEWVERQTKGRISNFLSSPISTSTLMMAINVLYFKGDWQYKFDPSDTETDAWFTQANGKTVKIPMMVNRLPLAFAHDPQMKTSVIELPYKAQRLGLFLLLPDEVSGIFHTMQMLNSTSFANLISSMRKPSPSVDQALNGINVRIPKFSIESSPRLSQILSQQLGLKTLFTPDSADLSGLFAPQASFPRQRSSNSSHNSFNSSSHTDLSQQSPPQVGLDELLHKAVLQVDEQGSVAAASSATIVERVGLFNSNYFEADHPFLLFLMDKQTGLVLFSGAFAGNNGNSNNQEPAQQRQQQQH